MKFIETESVNFTILEYKSPI